jgi:hypothetical protein
MTTPSPRRCSGQRSIGRSSRSRASSTWTTPGSGRCGSCSGTITGTATAASATLPRRSVIPGRMAPCSPLATQSTKTRGQGHRIDDPAHVVFKFAERRRQRWRRLRGVRGALNGANPPLSRPSTTSRSEWLAWTRHLPPRSSQSLQIGLTR